MSLAGEAARQQGPAFPIAQVGEHPQNIQAARGALPGRFKDQPPPFRIGGGGELPQCVVQVALGEPLGQLMKCVVSATGRSALLQFVVEVVPGEQPGQLALCVPAASPRPLA